MPTWMVTMTGTTAVNMHHDVHDVELVGLVASTKHWMVTMMSMTAVKMHVEVVSLCASVPVPFVQECPVTSLQCGNGCSCGVTGRSGDCSAYCYRKGCCCWALFQAVLVGNRRPDVILERSVPAAVAPHLAQLGNCDMAAHCRLHSHKNTRPSAVLQHGQNPCCT